MDKAIIRYLAAIGRAGGKRSRRTLSSEAARRMVCIREAQRAFRTFHARCFWSSPADYRVRMEDLAWVAERLMTYGGREGWDLGMRLCR